MTNTDILDMDEEELAAIKDMIPRAREFSSLASVKASIEDPRNEVVYALVPEKASSVGYGFIIIKGANKLRDLLSTHGGYVTELVIKCRTPGEALYLLDQFGEKNILQ